MVLEESYELNNGVAIPKLALGTWLIDDGASSFFPVFGGKL